MIPSFHLSSLSTIALHGKLLSYSHATGTFLVRMHSEEHKYTLYCIWVYVASTINIMLITVQDTTFFWWKRSSFSTSTQPDLNRATADPMLGSWWNHSPVTLLWRKISRAGILFLNKLSCSHYFSSRHRYAVINYLIRDGLNTKKSVRCKLHQVCLWLGLWFDFRNIHLLMNDDLEEGFSFLTSALSLQGETQFFVNQNIFYPQSRWCTLG